MSSDELCKYKEKEGTDPTGKSKLKEERVILCAACLHMLTSPDFQISVSGAHKHIFANPHGYVFEIGCYSTAQGGMTISERSSEFSWFPGFSWRVCGCSNCLAHIGWLFSSEANRFYGLILDRLIFP